MRIAAMGNTMALGPDDGRPRSSEAGSAAVRDIRLA
jgi:hypothetical protein